MAEIKVRKLDDWVVAVHRQLAEQSGDSLEHYFRQLLTSAAIETQHRFADSAEQRLKTLQDKYGVFSDSGELLRDERWERG